MRTNRNEFDVHEYATRDAAVAEINQQRITAAIDATSKPPQLLLSSASDPSGTRALIQLDQTQPGQFILPIVDLHPLPPSDPAGLATFYLVIAATILGFTTMFQLRANVKTLTLRRWLLSMAVLAVVGGAALAAVTGPVLGALSTPFAQLWLLISVQIAVAASFNSTMLVLIHRWAIIRPGWCSSCWATPRRAGGRCRRRCCPAVRVLQPCAAQRRDGVGDPRRDLLPAQPAAAAVHRAGGLWLVVSLAALIVASRTLRRSPAE